MKVVVCAKQVPDPEGPPGLDATTYRLRRDGKLVLDDADAVSIEIGVRAVASGGSGEVVLISMAPRNEVAGLRTGLALGADRAILLSDDRLAGADALATAKGLAAIVRGEWPVDLVLTASVSTDGYSGVVAAQLAELLGLPVLTFARRISVSAGGVHVERETELGYDELACGLPCVVSLTASAAPPRYPSYKAIVGARAKRIDVLTLEELGFSHAPSVGQEVVEVVDAPGRGPAEVIEDDGHGRAAERILEFLVGLKVL